MTMRDLNCLLQSIKELVGLASRRSLTWDYTYLAPESVYYLINLVKIIKNLQNNEVCNLKTDFMDTLIKNQNNSTLLGYTNETEVRPLKITGKIAGQNDYIRSILNLNIY